MPIAAGLSESQVNHTRNAGLSWEGDAMRHLKLRSLAFACGLALAVMTGGTAKAVGVGITYDVTIDINIPALGGVTAFSGPATIVVNFAAATPGSHASPGPLHVLGGSGLLIGNLAVGTALITGSVPILIAPSGTGFVGGAGAFTLNPAAAALPGAFVHCSNTGAGAACSTTLINLPASVSVPVSGLPFPFALSGTLGGFPSVGPQTIVAQGDAGTFLGVPLTATVTGVEVARDHSIPEPTSGAMLGLGLLGALIAGRAVRRRG